MGISTTYNKDHSTCYGKHPHSQVSSLCPLYVVILSKVNYCSRPYNLVGFIHFYHAVAKRFMFVCFNGISVQLNVKLGSTRLVLSQRSLL